VVRWDHCLASMRWAAALVLFVVAACGDSVTGTTHTSPPLPPLDPDGGVLPGNPVSVMNNPDAGVAPTGVDAGSSGVVPTPAITCAAGKTGAKGDITVTLMSGGYERDAILHVPQSYDPTKGTMLVLNFHGFTSNAAEQVILTGMNPVADAKNFVVAYPDGIGNGWNAGDCCTELQPVGVNDVQFVKDLLALLESEYCVDPSRVFSTGFSNGGFFSHMLACDMADVFAAVAPVSGVLGIPTDQCQPSRPVPVLDMHGTADPVVPYDGGPALKLVPGIVFMGVPETMTFWRGVDSCLDPGAVVYQQGDATCVLWAGCAGTADVELCTLEGDGHQWPDSSIDVPGLGNESTSINATETIVEWFLAHTM
jgi:polyhydroxybutyrate depolymerase